MALRKTIKYKGIDLNRAYFVISDYKSEKLFKKTLTNNDGNSQTIEGRGLITITVFANKQAYQSKDEKLYTIEDIPFEGENNVFNQQIRESIVGADFYIDDEGKKIDFDKTNIEYYIYTLLKQKYSQFQGMEDC